MPQSGDFLKESPSCPTSQGLHLKEKCLNLLLFNTTSLSTLDSATQPQERGTSGTLFREDSARLDGPGRRLAFPATAPVGEHRQRPRRPHPPGRSIPHGASTNRSR